MCLIIALIISCLLEYKTHSNRPVDAWRHKLNGAPSILPALDVVFQFTAGQRFSAMVSEGAGHSQLVQQLVHQQAGLPAALQH